MPLQIPPSLHFSCTNCGDCCRRYSILLGPGERERIEALDWEGRRPELVGARVCEELHEAGYRNRVRLARREADTCIFLGEKSQCLIHEHFGAELKPLICRLYPFAFSPLGDRVCLNVSFACRAISEEHGEPLSAENTPELNELADKSLAQVRELPHRLRKDVAIAGELLWQVEGILLDYLADRTMPLRDRIRCILQFLHLGTTGKPDAPRSAEFRAIMAHGIAKKVREKPAGPFTFDKTQRAMFFQWLYLSLNPAPGWIYTLPPLERKAEEQRRIEQGTRFTNHQGRPVIDDHELNCDFDTVQRIDAGLLQRDEMQLPAMYLCSKIIGQRFLQLGKGEQPLVDAIPRLLLSYPMIAWTAKALAADRAATAVEQRDVRAALRLIDIFINQTATVALPQKLTETLDFLLGDTDLILSAIDEVLPRPT